MSDAGWLIGIGVVGLIIWSNAKNKEDEIKREEEANKLQPCSFCKTQHRFRDLRRESWWQNNTLVCSACFEKYGICAKCNCYTNKTALTLFWNISRFVTNTTLSRYPHKSGMSTSWYCQTCFREVSSDEQRIIDAFKRCPSSQVEQQRYYGTFHWQQLKAKHHCAAYGTCETCGIKNVQLQLHHRHYKTIGVEAISDLELLCINCHQQRHPNNIYIGPRGGQYKWKDGKRSYL